jgi:hypothetical protein
VEHGNEKCSVINVEVQAKRKPSTQTIQQITGTKMGIEKLWRGYLGFMSTIVGALSLGELTFT